jgi:hypothetical protein
MLPTRQIAITLFVGMVTYSGMSNFFFLFQADQEVVGVIENAPYVPTAQGVPHEIPVAGLHQYDSPSLPDEESTQRNVNIPSKPTPSVSHASRNHREHIEKGSVFVPVQHGSRHHSTRNITSLTKTSALSSVIVQPGKGSIPIAGTHFNLSDQRKERLAILKIPTPIFVASLPKSATTSTAKFFSCGGLRTAHYWHRNKRKDPTIIFGQVIEKNVVNGRPPFEGCGDFDVFADTGYITRNGRCFHPEVDGLDAIYQAYPNSTIVYVTRETESWLSSLVGHRNGRLKEKWGKCNATGFPKQNASDEDFRSFHDWHTKLIRKFAQEHPSMTYLEFELEDPEIAENFETATGIESHCWGQHNQSPTPKSS